MLIKQINLLQAVLLHEFYCFLTLFIPSHRTCYGYLTYIFELKNIRILIVKGPFYIFIEICASETYNIEFMQHFKTSLFSYLIEQIFTV